MLDTATPDDFAELADFGFSAHFGHPQTDAAEKLEAWLSPLADLPIGNERLVMAIASLLTAHGIGHRSVMGSVAIADVGPIPRHHWVELDAGLCLDFRARRWLWHDPRVPHGAFLPDEGDRHDAHRFVNGHYSPTVFFALVGAPMADFPIPQGLALLLENGR